MPPNLKLITERAIDLRIDAVAKEAATLVRERARGEDPTRRFLSRFLDHLHDLDVKTGPGLPETQR